MTAVRMPYSEESEKSVIGGILLHPRALVDAAANVSADEFYHPALRAIFEAMVQVDRASKPVDPITVVDEMRSLGTIDKLRAFNGAEFLTQLMADVVTVSNIAYHAKVVRSRAERRRRILAAIELQQAGISTDLDDDSYRAQWERTALELSAVRQDPRLVHVRPTLREVIQLVGKRYEAKSPLTGIPTGFEDLDELTGGLQDEDLVIIAGRPSMGKSAFMAAVIRHAAAHAGIPSLLFSLEMSRTSIAERLLATDGDVALKAIRSGRLQQRDWSRITIAASRLSDAPIWIDDTGGISVEAVRSRARQWRLQHTKPEQKCLVVLDYLQLGSVDERQKNQTRERDVAQYSAGLKALAKDLRCPVIALSQLNRSVETRSDKHPLLSDLRESGSLEQDADLILFLYRDEVYSKNECRPEDRGIAEVIIGKQRNGPLGVVRLKWLEESTSFRNLHHQQRD